MAAIKPRTKSKVKSVYYEAVGRRKEASSRVRLALGTVGTFEKGKIYVNEKPIEQVFPGNLLKHRYEAAFAVTNTLGRFTVTAHTIGGGVAGQIDAFVLACARSLVKADASYRSVLKAAGLLMVDARQRERRKAGLAQKARKEKQSPKR